MIDHISIGVSDLEKSAAFYGPVLETIGLLPMMVRSDTIGYGKKHPEFWLNRRDGMARVTPDTGIHICLRARSVDAVQAFYEAALAAGAEDDGPPGMRPHYDETYYAAFVRDPDSNRIEVVTFVTPENA